MLLLLKPIANNYSLARARATQTFNAFDIKAIISKTVTAVEYEHRTKMKRRFILFLCFFFVTGKTEMK